MACRTWANQKGTNLQICTSWDRTIHHTFHVTRQHVYLFLFNSLYLNVAYLHGYTCSIRVSERSQILYLIWMAIYPVLYSYQLATDEILNLTSPDLVCRAQAAMREPYLWRTADMSWRMWSLLNKSNPIQSIAVAFFTPMKESANCLRLPIVQIWPYLFVVGKTSISTFKERNFNSIVSIVTHDSFWNFSTMSAGSHIHTYLWHGGCWLYRSFIYCFTRGWSPSFRELGRMTMELRANLAVAMALNPCEH